MAADPRQLAVEILAQVERGGFLDALVGRTLEREPLDRRSAALLTRLAYGTEVWRGRLDWTLTALVRQDLARLEPTIRVVLRLGLLQLVLLDRIPAHAAVDTSVEMAKRASGRGAAGLVNAVLKRAARDGERPPPPAEENLTEHLAVRWSHPRWLVERWLEVLGPERTCALLQANDEPGPTTIRVDRRLRSREEALRELAAREVSARAGAYAPDAIVIDGPLAALDGLSWAHPQGEASQLVAALVAPTPGERIGDLCAAPGGKSAAMAERSTHGLVVAADRSSRGLARLASRATQRGDRNLVVARADAIHPPFRTHAFDAVLVDAPCSGLGTLRAHPEIRWRRGPEDVLRLARVQREILAAAAPLVRPGGRLVYATCTLLPEENDAVIADFLAAHRDWQRADARAALEGAAESLVDDEGALRTAPDLGGLDGFFAVVLRKASEPL